MDDAARAALWAALVDEEPYAKLTAAIAMHWLRRAHGGRRAGVSRFFPRE